MAKIVYNACYGGFGLSEKAIERYAELKGVSVDSVDAYGIPRNDPVLVQIVEELGEDVNSNYGDLLICELPSGTRYRIEEYDGLESVVTEYKGYWDIA